MLGGWATANVGKLLTNRFSVPGSDAERGLEVLKARFHERGDGAFTLPGVTKIATVTGISLAAMSWSKTSGALNWMPSWLT